MWYKKYRKKGQPYESAHGKVITKELIRQVKEYIPDYHEYEIEDVLEATFDIIKYLIESGEKVEIKNFGKFYLKRAAQKRMYDPNTKTVVQSPGRPKVVFEVNRSYQDKVRFHETTYDKESKQKKENTD